MTLTAPKQMHCAMQDSKYLYFLMDLLPGGTLCDLLEHKAHLPEEWVRFYAASVRGLVSWLSSPRLQTVWFTFEMLPSGSHGL
jgi:hypothetical protein